MGQREELFERKRRAMKLMDGGMLWEEANEQSGLNYSHTGIQHLGCPTTITGSLTYPFTKYISYFVTPISRQYGRNLPIYRVTRSDN